VRKRKRLRRERRARKRARTLPWERETEPFILPWERETKPFILPWEREQQPYALPAFTSDSETWTDKPRNIPKHKQGMDLLCPTPSGPNPIPPFGTPQPHVGKHHTKRDTSLPPAHPHLKAALQMAIGIYAGYSIGKFAQATVVHLSPRAAIAKHLSQRMIPIVKGVGIAMSVIGAVEEKPLISSIGIGLGLSAMSIARYGEPTAIDIANYGIYEAGKYVESHAPWSWIVRAGKYTGIVP